MARSSILPSLPSGWSVQLELPSSTSTKKKGNQNEEIEVIVKKDKEIAKGKKAIERLVNNKCSTIEEKRVIFTHVKWNLKRAEGLKGMTNNSTPALPVAPSSDPVAAVAAPTSTVTVITSKPPISSPSPLPPPLQDQTQPQKRGRKRTRVSAEEQQPEQQNVEDDKKEHEMQSLGKIRLKSNESTTISKKDSQNLWDFSDSSSTTIHLRRAEYLRWLKSLQLNQNILCFGIGSKYEIIHNFATTVLTDEDVIEWNSSSSSNTSQRKRSGEEILWELFQFIREQILKPSCGAGGNRIPSSSVWNFHSDGNKLPLEFEAQLVSDHLCRHYSWNKSAMGKNASNRQRIIREILRKGTHLQEECSGEEVLNDDDDTSDNSRSIPESRSEPPSPSIVAVHSFLSRESTKLLTSNYKEGTPNLDYVNSVSRLYLLLHSIDELFSSSSSSSSSFQTNTNTSLSRAFSILVSCPVISVVASMTSLQTPLISGWNPSTECSCQWVYTHTPSTISQETLPEILSSTSASHKTQRDRSVTLKYVLNSLTSKHLQLLKYLLQFNSQSPSTSSATTPTTSTTATTTSSSGSVRWVQLLQHCTERLIVKNDDELRDLVRELKDQRMIKTFSDSDGVVFVTLSLTATEKESVSEYFQKEKKK